MLAYSKDNSVSLEKGDLGKFKPIIIIRKEIKDVSLPSGAEELTYLSNLLHSGIYFGGAIFRNDESAEVLESVEGITGGGEIYVTPNYVSVFYLTGENEFTVFKASNAEMRPSFTQISPLSYISTTGSRFIGATPVGYLPYAGGSIESYSTNEAMNLPSFDRCLLVDGQPFAYYGLATGTLGLNFIPVTKKGIFRALLRNRLYGSEVKKYSEKQGVVLSTTTRSKARTLVNKIVKGENVDDFDWCRLYVCPESLLLSAPSSFYCLKMLTESDYLAVGNVAFPPSECEVGPAVREYINSPCFENAQFTSSSPDVEAILREYEALLEALKKEGLATGAKVAINEMATVYDHFYNAYVEGHKSITFDFKWVEKPVKISVNFDGLVLPKPSIKMDRVTVNELRALSSEQITSKYTQAFRNATKVAKALDLETLDVKVGSETIETKTFKFNQQKFNKLFDDIGEDISSKVLKRIQTVLQCLETSPQGFNPGKVTYTFKKGCKKETVAYPAYGCWQSYVGSPASTMTTAGVNGDLTYSANGRKLGSVMSFDDIYITSIKYANNRIKFSYQFGMKALMSAMLHAGFSEASAMTDLVNWIRQSLARISGISFGVSGNGIASSDPFGSGKKEGKCGVQGFWLWKKCVEGSDYACPLFNIGVRIDDEFEWIYSADSKFTDPDLADNLFTICENNIKAINNSAQKQAVNWLIDELTKEGLISKVMVIGKLEETLVPVTDIVKFANFDPSSALTLFYKAFSKILASGAPLPVNEEALIRENLENITRALKYAGVTPNGDNFIQTEREHKIPWIMDFGHMTYDTIGVDLNLLPFYCNF